MTDEATQIAVEPVADDPAADVRAAIEQLKGADTSTDEIADKAAATGDEGATPQNDRTRDERGRFTAKAEDGAEQQPEPAPKNADEDTTKEKPAEPSNASAPPTSWSDAAKADWSRASPALQQAVAKREAEMEAGRKQWSEKEQRYEQVLSPVADAARKAGVSPQEGLNRLLAANAYLESNPQAAIRDLANFYGVDLSKINQQQPQAPRVDPATAQLHQRISSLESDLRSRSQSETEATIQAFASAPGHEHFEAVKQVMGRLMTAGQATSLQDAYDQAIWAMPDIRAKLLAAQTQQATQAQKQRDTVDRAKRGALSVSGSPGASSAGAPTKDYETARDAAVAAARQHGWAV